MQGSWSSFCLLLPSFFVLTYFNKFLTYCLVFPYLSASQSCIQMGCILPLPLLWVLVPYCFCSLDCFCPDPGLHADNCWVACSLEFSSVHHLLSSHAVNASQGLCWHTKFRSCNSASHQGKRGDGDSCLSSAACIREIKLEGEAWTANWKKLMSKVEHCTSSYTYTTYTTYTSSCSSVPISGISQMKLYMFWKIIQSMGCLWRVGKPTEKLERSPFFITLKAQRH